MSVITLKDLLYVIPDLINLFLSGFIFMEVYDWLNNRKTDTSLLTVWSLFISYIIKMFYSAVHTVILSKVSFVEPIKILLYCVTGIVLAIICTLIKPTKPIYWLLNKINNKSINDDVFDDIIDYNTRTMMQIHMKSSPTIYIGRFVCREEKGLDSWIVLADYSRFDKNLNKSIFCPADHDIGSTVTINSRDIESIELIYEDNSDVWKRISGENNN